MSNEPTLFEQARGELERIQKMATEFGADTSKWTTEQIAELRKKAEKFDDLAGKAALQGEDLYEKLDVERRAKGFVIGAKAGLITLKFAWIASPILGALGALFPKYSTDLADKWLDRHRRKRDSEADQDGPQPK